MNKAERHHYLEYCREIYKHNRIEAAKYKRIRKPIDDEYRIQSERFDQAPWWKMAFMLPPTPVYVQLFAPYYQKPTIDDFYRWLAEKEANAQT